MSSTTAIRNIALKALRRVQSAHKPLVRLSRQRARRDEARAAWREVGAIERELGRIAASGEPIVVGPWLAEVGYEALYWVPFVRWFQDAFRIPPDQMMVVSRGGVRDWYADVAGSYVDIFDVMTTEELAARNSERQKEGEGGGRKQTFASRLDQEIVARARDRARVRAGAVCHPSLMFRLFRHVWHGMLPHDYLWTHTRYAPLTMSDPLPPGLPSEFSVAKFYTGTALPAEPWIYQRLRTLVTREAERRPVILLDTDEVRVDEHADYGFADIPNVVSAREWMTPSTNLAVQSALIARAQRFLSTCGGLAWLSPMLGTPVVAAYADDRLLGPHLYVAGQVVKRLHVPELLPLDLRAEQWLGV